MTLSVSGIKIPLLDTPPRKARLHHNVMRRVRARHATCPNDTEVRWRLDF